MITITSRAFVVHLFQPLPKIADMEAEFAQKEREKEWLDRVGGELAQDGEEGAGEMVRTAAERWTEVRNIWDRRSSRLSEDKDSAKRFTSDLAELKSWMKDVEQKLNRPVSVLDTTEKEYKKRRKEYLDLQKRIKKKKSKAEDVLAGCEAFLARDDCSWGFDALRTAHANLRKRWDVAKAKSVSRADELDRLWKDWCAFNSEYSRLQDFVGRLSEDLRTVDAASSAVSRDSLSDVEDKLEAMKAELDSSLPELEALNDRYCELAREYRLDSSDDLKGKFIAANNDWEDVGHEIGAILKRIGHSRQLYSNYAGLREREMNWLRQTDAELTELEFSSAMTAEEKRSGLARLKRATAARTPELDRVAEAGVHLLQRSDARDAEKAEEIVNEFNDLRADVTERMDNLVAELQPSEGEDEDDDQDKDDAVLPPISVHSSVQVSTLKFDSSVQADTLQLMADSGVSVAGSWQTTTTGATTSPSAASPQPDIMERFAAEFEQEREADNARLKEESGRKSRGGLETDLQQFLSEFHANGDKLEDALVLEASAPGEELSSQDLVSLARVCLSSLCTVL